MKRKLIGKWHAAAFLVFCFVFALTASGVFYNQRGKLAGEYGNMVASNLTSYTQAQKRYLNSSITDAWNTLKGISGLVEQMIPEYTEDSLNGYLEEEDNALSTLKMQMEDFYVAEKDADILIYNGTIEGELNSVDELIAKNSLFADFKAVQSGDVYTTGSNFYQETSATCDFIEDLNKILTDSGDTDYRFIQKLK